jgi:hypothetical protein
MEGGINAWQGLVAEGAPQSGMAYFSPATKPEELMALAWYLEDGSCKFYSELSVSLSENEVKDLYMQLAKAEEHHQASLLKLYEEFPGRAPEPGLPELVLPRAFFIKPLFVCFFNSNKKPIRWRATEALSARKIIA